VVDIGIRAPPLIGNNRKPVAHVTSTVAVGPSVRGRSLVVASIVEESERLSSLE
jgi:hypothetical protein